jgi:hypothetical protein
VHEGKCSQLSNKGLLPVPCRYSDLSVSDRPLSSHLFHRHKAAVAELRLGVANLKQWDNGIAGATQKSVLYFLSTVTLDGGMGIHEEMAAVEAAVVGRQSNSEVGHGPR